MRSLPLDGADGPRRGLLRAVQQLEQCPRSLEHPHGGEHLGKLVHRVDTRELQEFLSHLWVCDLRRGRQRVGREEQIASDFGLGLAVGQIHDGQLAQVPAGSRDGAVRVDGHIFGRQRDGTSGDVEHPVPTLVSDSASSLRRRLPPRV